ncbi:MAG: formimidoylglutamate deiminase [Actinobacteria bacterium]|nr:formimidoylglutamate deiminase [Actinomycetota bacterium]
MRQSTHLRVWWAERAWMPGGVAERVLLTADGDRLEAVTAGADPPADAARLPGLVLPGLVNAHSHAFHRALRGRTESDPGDFWSWRARMYELALRLDPDRYHALARAVYAEMALAGITAVGEFHYLHHAPGGRPYAEPNAMGAALAAAADEAGLRLTLVDTCYLRGDFDVPLRGPQLRFGDADAEAWARRASDAAAELPGVRMAAGAHSVRAVPPDSMDVVAGWAAERDAPLHVHLSEQPAENEACLAATGRTPAALADEHGLLGPRTTAVHATHVTAGDVKRLGSGATAVCLCPTTERSLADGIGPAAALRDAGSPLCVGSDSHAVVDLFEEARAVELDERLATGRRGHHRPEALLRAATAGGAAALGWDAGTLAPGRLADFVAVDTAGVRLAGAGRRDLPTQVVFAATAADVTHVVVGGRPVVDDRAHVRVGDVGRALGDAIREVTAP